MQPYAVALLCWSQQAEPGAKRVLVSGPNPCGQFLGCEDRHQEAVYQHCQSRSGQNTRLGARLVGQATQTGRCGQQRILNVPLQKFEQDVIVEPLFGGLPGAG